METVRDEIEQVKIGDANHSSHPLIARRIEHPDVLRQSGDKFFSALLEYDFKMYEARREAATNALTEAGYNPARFDTIIDDGDRADVRGRALGRREGPAGGQGGAGW